MEMVTRKILDKQVSLLRRMIRMGDNDLKYNETVLLLLLLLQSGCKQE